jgi:hypothetical protein
MLELFKKYWFALFSILIGAVFSVLAEFSKEHDYTFFVIFISVLYRSWASGSR